MARVVCQVVPRADRLTFIWSEGAAAFEPYHLAGAELSAFDAAAEQARAALDGDAVALAGLGQRLYRALFRLDAAGGEAAQGIGRWLLELHGQGQVEALEFLGEAAARVPWNVLCEANSQSPWGTRFNLAAGRRTNSLRLAPALVNPTALLAADGALLDQVTGADRAQLESWHGERLIVESADALASQLRQRTPDVLVLLARVEGDALVLGGQRVTPHALRDWIGEAREGNPNPLVFLGGAGAGEQAATWERWLAAATAEIDGLVTNVVPLSAATASAQAVDAAARFLQSRASLGAVLVETRTALGPAALALTAFCPPFLRAAEAEDAEAGPGLPRQPLPDEPYCPLRAYGPGERPLFLGREEETLRLATLLEQDATAGVIVHGSAAVGKSSLLQAGLWPFLDQESVGFRLLSDRTPEETETPAAESDYPPLLLRPGSDLAGQLADALFRFCAQPLTYATPTGQTVTVDLPALLAAHAGTTSTTAIQATAPAVAPEPGAAEADEDEAGPGPAELWQALRNDPARLGRLLDDVTRRLPFELVVTIDDGEDLLELSRTPAERERRRQALDMLLAVAESPARCKFVLVLRTEYFGQLAGLLPARPGRALWQEFFVDELGEAAMVDALLAPTSRDEVLYADEAPFAKYGFAYEDGLAQQIVADVVAEAQARQVGPLALLQVVGGLLYEQRVLRRRIEVLRALDLRDVGGARGALVRYVNQRIDRLSMASAALNGIRSLVQRLTVRHTDGRVTRALVPARTLKESWRSSVPIEQAVSTAAEQGGLFEIDQLLVGGEPGLYVGLAHDAIAQAGRLGSAGGGSAGGGGSKRAGVIDTLWIMVPLAVLAAVLTWYFTRSHFATEMKEYRDQVEERVPQFVEQQVAARTNTYRGPLFRGQLAEADELLNHGNALGARQLLLREPAVSADPQLAMRGGFEWDYLWNRANAERFNLAGHQGAVSSVSVSGDRQLAASASADGTVRLWHLATGEAAALIPAKGVHAVALAPDGKTVAAAGADKVVRVWTLPALGQAFVTLTEEPKTLTGHTAAVLALAFAKDGKTLASAGADHTVMLWDMPAGKARAPLKEHASPVQALAFTPDGKTLASGAAEPTVVLWTVESGKKAHTIATGLSSVAAVAFNADGTSLTAGGVRYVPGLDGGAARTWPVNKDGTPGQGGATVQHGRGVQGLAYLPGGKIFASAGTDTTVRLWDAASGAEVGRRIGHLGWVPALAATADGLLVTGSHDQTVKVWSVAATRAEQVIAAHTDWVRALTFLLTVQGQVLVSGGNDGAVKVWDGDSGELLHEAPMKAGPVTAIAVAPASLGSFAAGTWDKNGGSVIKLWELTPDAKTKKLTSNLKKTLEGPKAGITCLAFNLPGNRLAAGMSNKAIVIWDVGTGKIVKTIAAGTEVHSLSFALGRELYAAGADKAVRAWDTESGQLRVGPFPAHGDTIEGIDFLTLGTGKGQESIPGVLTASLDNNIALLIVEGGVLTPRITAHAANHPISCLVRRSSPVAPSLIATGGWDGTVRLWNIEARSLGKEEAPQLDLRERFTLSAGSPVRAVAVSMDQSVVAAGNRDGAVHIWRGAGPLSRLPAGKRTK